MKALANCYPYWGQIATHPKEGFSVSCVGPGEDEPTEQDEDGNDYIVGTCQCDLPIIDFTSDIFMEAAAATGSIGCEIFFGTMDLVLEVTALAIPGVDELDGASAGMQIAVKTATQMAENGQDGIDFLQMFAGLSEDNIFLPLIGKGKPGRGIVKDGHGKLPDTPPTTSKPSDPVKASDPAKPSKPTDPAKSSKTGKPLNPSQKSVVSEILYEKAVLSLYSKYKKTHHKSAPEKTTSPHSDPTSTSHHSTTTKTSTKSKSTSSLSSSSKTSYACSARKTKTPALVRRERAVYEEPDDCELDHIIDLLKDYSHAKSRELLVHKIVASYMRNSNPKKDASMFSIGKASKQAATLKLKNNKETIETVFWGYSQGPFDAKKQPMKRTLELDPLAGTAGAKGIQSAWFKATSAAFARVTTGKAYLLYDNQDWKAAEGGDGKPSIFITDELPEMQDSGKVSKVYEICTSVADMWNSTIATTLNVMKDFSCEYKNNGVPAVLIWEK